MRITLESDYALRMIQTLALEDTILDAKTLSERTNVPPKFALKILRKLMAAEIVCSYKGAHGGYRLNKLPSDVTIKDVIEVFEGKIFISRCLDCEYICSRMGEEKDNCAFHRAFCEVSDVLSKCLSKISIQNILDESN